MAGTYASPYLPRGGWQFDLSYRTLTSNTHYSGTERQLERETEETYVVNQQRLADFTVTYGVTDRVAVSLGIPVVDASWSIPLPVRPVPGMRSEQNARGLGDLSVTGRYWLFDTSQASRNLSLGVGLKLPTGDASISDSYPDLTGANPEVKAVDQSIQPGDGGWGIVLDVNGFKSLGRATLFGNFAYLMNPRNTNDTPSIIAGLGLSDRPGLADLLVNSVPDQYVGRVGVAVPVKETGVTTSLAARIEGLPRYDLLGRSDGWRRPGREVFLEPGVSYDTGHATLSFSMPIAIYRNRLPNPYTGRAGDATFPNYIFLAGLSFRFGEPERESPPVEPQPAASVGSPAEPALRVASGDAFPAVGLRDVSGTATGLAEILAPGRRTLVNLWATWCEPCREEMPFLAGLADELDGAGIDLVGVSLDEDPDVVPPFLEELGIDYPIYVASGLEPIEEIYRGGRIVLPASVLLDDGGRIVQVFEGWSDETAAAVRVLARP